MSEYGEDHVPLLADDTAGSLRSANVSRCVGFGGIPVTFYCIALYLLTETFDFIIIAPMTALFEGVICQQYYTDNRAAVAGATWDCKASPIQRELAVLRGWKRFFDALPVFLVALPLGSLSDRHGRKIVLASSILGVLFGFAWIMIVCTSSNKIVRFAFLLRLTSCSGHFPSVFPIRLVWLSSTMYLFGGGLFQANASVMLIAAESSSDKSRSRVMYYIYSSYLVTELIAPSIAAVAIEKSLWIAFGTGIASLVLCFSIIPLLPNTRQLERSSVNTASLLQTAGYDNGPSTNDSSASIGNSQTGSLPVQSHLLSLFKRRNILLTVPIFIIGVFRPPTLNLLLQYTSIRFGWSFSNAALLTSEVAGVGVVLFLVVLPQAIILLQERCGYHPQVIDLSILRTSLALLCIRATMIGLASSSSSLIASGFGCRMSVVALSMSWLDGDLRARFFGAIQVLENVGLLISDPIMQNMFAVALRLSDAWLALPFFFASGIYLLATIAAFFIHFKIEDQPLS
ncbi:hypothetical protein BDV96DRAFT_569813 [Lophiotrema nucula]|uniref:Major facilitator superfamily domain-containing protein n=1 Tax=Lophiotrema nucula TaxID=690887 RepID=A0A6A5ZIY0_9PLEO|nr:hypothetical protein BDV96DRAFT_569813 [Lophiotrema nucula]